MIERDFVKRNKKEFQIQEFVVNNLSNVGHSKTKMIRTPLGEKIIVYASRPGLVVGREGQNIKKLTVALKKKFNLENPQIEIAEVEDVNLDANIVAERIANSLERFGLSKFKGVGHKMMSEVMGAGALGIEILISGKVPSSRARRWRFYQGYLKKCGDIALTGVDTAYSKAKLKTGVVGIQVRIMPPDTKLPDNIQLIEDIEEVVEGVKEGEKEAAEEVTEEVSEAEEVKEQIEENKESKSSQSSSEAKTKKEKPDKEGKSPQGPSETGTEAEEETAAEENKE